MISLTGRTRYRILAGNHHAVIATPQRKLAKLVVSF